MLIDYLGILAGAYICGTASWVRTDGPFNAFLFRVIPGVIGMGLMAVCGSKVGLF